MASKGISDLILKHEDVISLLQDLIKEQTRIKGRLDDKIEEIRRHHFKCNVARSIGTASSVFGTILSVQTGCFSGIAGPPVLTATPGIVAAGAVLTTASLVPGVTTVSLVPALEAVAMALGLVGTGSVGTGIALGALLFGKSVSIITDCVDAVKSQEFIREAKQAANAQKAGEKILKDKLDEFQKFLETIQSSECIEMLENTGLHLNERFSRLQSALVQGNSDKSGSMSTDNDASSLVDNFLAKVSDVAEFVNILNPSESVKWLNIVVQVAFVLKEIGKVVQGWINKHPTEELVCEIRERIVESIKTLKRLAEDLKENVELLNKRRLVIEAIVTFEAVSHLVNPLVLKQQKTVNRIFKELDEMSNKHWIVWIITGVLGIFLTSVVLVALLLILFQFQEVRFGSLTITVPGFLFIIFAAYYGDVPSKPAVKKMLNELKCPEYNWIETATRHRKLKELLEPADTTSTCLKEENGFTPHENDPLYEAAKRIDDKIDGDFDVEESSSKLSPWMQDFLTEASMILKAIWKLEDLGDAIGCWAEKNNVKKKRLLSELPNGYIDSHWAVLKDYTDNIDKLLEVLQTSS